MRSVFTYPRTNNTHRHGDSRYTTPCRGRCRQHPPILRNLGRMPTATIKLSSLSRRRTFARRTPPLACTPLFARAFSCHCGEQVRRRLLAHGKNCRRCPSGSWRATCVQPSEGSVWAFVLVHGLISTKYSVIMINEAMAQRSAVTWQSFAVIRRQTQSQEAPRICRSMSARIFFFIFGWGNCQRGPKNVPIWVGTGKRILSERGHA